ncbi:MAG: hypothetical protein AAFP86_10650, partial [Planctomycetota bacterium]
LNKAEFRKDPNFGFEVPVKVPNVSDVLLDPRRTWNDKTAYDAQAKKLVDMFAENFGQYAPFVGDDVKDSGPAVTLAVIDATRQLSDRAGVGFDYRHQEFPELRRNDFPPVNDDALADARVDRLSANGWRWIREKSEVQVGMRAFGRIGAWSDEEDDGGDASLGLEFHGLFSSRDRLDLAGFASEGKFSGLQGGRVRYGRFRDRDAWSVLYELRMNDVTGFEIDADDFVQHRIRGSYELRPSPGFTASLYVEGQLQDTEDQVFFGLFLQRSF